MNDGAFYFGCWKEAGHFLHSPGGRPQHVEYTLPDDFPLSYRILDGGLLPPKQRSPEVEGLATFIHINGWSVMSFWDRSIDKRGACNSAFLFRGLMTFDEACALAAELFPSVWNRFTFKVVQRGDRVAGRGTE